MAKLGHIYKITNPTGAVYIGQTTVLNKRIAKYKATNRSIIKQRMLYNSLQKYGWNNHKFEILEEFVSDDYLTEILNASEIYWIVFYKTNKCKFPDGNGMNLTNGGSGIRGYKLSNKMIKEMSDRQIDIKRKPLSEEHKQIISRANKGRIRSEESKQKNRLAHLGKKLSEENKVMLKLLNSQRKHTPEEIKKMQQNSSKMIPITQYTLEGDYVKDWISCGEAARELRLSKEGIRKCVVGDNKKSGGFVWKIKEN